jgi:hypothetical protein
MLLSNSMLSLLSWFLTAPAPRFARGALYVFFAATVAWAYPRLSRMGRSVLATMIVIVTLAGVCSTRLYRLPELTFQPLPTDQLSDATTEAGLRLKVGTCYDAPLPCSPYYLPWLSLRDSHDLRHGFRINLPPGWRLDPPRAWPRSGRDDRVYDLEEEASLSEIP